MVKMLITAFYADENILYFNKESGNVVFTCNGTDILNIDLNNINLDDTNYDEVDPDTIILVRLLTWHFKFKALKKELNEELMLTAWHPKRWWNFVLKYIIKEYLKQFWTQRIDTVQNMLIPLSPKIPPEANCANTLIL